MPILKLLNFIDGKFVPPSTGEYINNINPATDKVISLVGRSNENDGNVAIESCI